MAKIIWREPEAMAASTSAAGQASAMGGGSSRATREREQESGFEDSSIEKPTEDDRLEVCHEGAWYEAKLTVRGRRIRVAYVEYVSDREFWDVATIQQADPLRDLVRVVSPQLQDAECGAISVNTQVCALRKSEDEDGWYDAIVKEVVRRIHAPNGDGGEICTCSFTVVWIAGPDKARVRKHLRCEHLCTISRKDVRHHPLILEILNSCSQRGKKVVDDQSGSSSQEGLKRRLQLSNEQNELSTVGDVGSSQQAAKKLHLGIDIDIPCHSQPPDTSVDQSESGSKAEFIAGDKQKSCSGSDIDTEADLKTEVFPKQGSTVPFKSEFSRGNESCEFFNNVMVTPKAKPTRSTQNLSLLSEEKEHVLRKPMGQLPSSLNGDEDMCCAGKYLAELMNNCRDPNDGGEENKSGLETEREATFKKPFQKKGAEFFRDVICLSDDDEIEGLNKQSTDLIGNRKAISEQLRQHSGCVLVIDNLEMDATRVQIMHLLLRFCPREKIHSIYIPFPYYVMKHAVGYVVFVDKQTADSAAAFLTQNLVVSSRGRPLSIKCGEYTVEDRLNRLPSSEFTDLATIKVDNHIKEQLKIITPQDEVYGVSMAHLKLFIQSQILYESHKLEEIDVEPHLIFLSKWVKSH